MRLPVCLVVSREVLLRNDVDHGDGAYVLFVQPIVLGHTTQKR
jgi:hypothetical protein